MNPKFQLNPSNTFNVSKMNKTPSFNTQPCIPKPTPPSPFDVSQTGSHLNVGRTFPNIVNNGPHHLDANAYGKIPLTKQTPPGVGGGLQYRHDFGHSASVNVDHVQSMGTTVQAQANARLFESKDRSAHVDLSAGAAQHFSPHGSSKIQGQGMLSLTKKF